MKEPLRSKRLLCLMITAFVLLWGHAHGQARKVTGTIKDAASGDALPGVSILVRGTTNGTITNADGAFAIDVSSEEDVLVISFVGFVKEEIPVSGKTTIDVILTPDI